MNAPIPVNTLARPPFVPGVFYDMPAETYHAIEAMSASGAKKMLRSPQHYKLMRDKPKPSTEDQQLYTAIHAGVLEPDTFDARVIAAPEINRRTKDGRAEWTAFNEANAGRVVLSAENFAIAQRGIAAVRAHPTAQQLLDGARCEVSIFWIDRQFNVPCKARIDAWAMNIIVADLKSSDDASRDHFAMIAAKNLYHVQAAQYFSAAEHGLDVTPEAFVFIVVEDSEPHAVACYRLPAAAILAGRFLMDIALERYARALETGRYDGYPLTIDTLPFPRRALRFDV